jgi:hypothetical protein
MEIDFKSSGAILSIDRKYRYALWRTWHVTKPKVMMIGLNPSKATESKNDNTITKVIKVASFNGFGGVVMMNLFGLVSPHPEDLHGGNDPIGENDSYLQQYSKECKAVVFCWGNFKIARERAKQVSSMFPEALCFVKNKNGSPRHPLYCLDETILIPFK